MPRRKKTKLVRTPLFLPTGAVVVEHPPLPERYVLATFDSGHLVIVSRVDYAKGIRALAELEYNRARFIESEIPASTESNEDTNVRTTRRKKRVSKKLIAKVRAISAKKPTSK